MTTSVCSRKGCNHQHTVIIDNAPMSKALVLVCGGSSILFSVLNVKSRLALVDLYTNVLSKYEVWRLFTTHLFFNTPGELLFGLLLLYHFRLFERQMGTLKFSVCSTWNTQVTRACTRHSATYDDRHQQVTLPNTHRMLCLRRVTFLSPCASLRWCKLLSMFCFRRCEEVPWLDRKCDVLVCLVHGVLVMYNIWFGTKRLNTSFADTAICSPPSCSSSLMCLPHIVSVFVVSARTIRSLLISWEPRLPCTSSTKKLRIE
jgi:hypothetical protein